MWRHSSTAFHANTASVMEGSKMYGLDARKVAITWPAWSHTRMSTPIIRLFTSIASSQFNFTVPLRGPSHFISSWPQGCVGLHAWCCFAIRKASTISDPVRLTCGGEVNSSKHKLISLQQICLATTTTFCISSLSNLPISNSMMLIKASSLLEHFSIILLFPSHTSLADA